MIYGRSSENLGQSGRPSALPLIEDKNASLFTAFYPIGQRDVKEADNGIFLFAIRGQEEGADNSQ